MFTVPRLELRNQFVFSQLRKLPLGNSWQPVTWQSVCLISKGFRKSPLKVGRRGEPGPKSENLPPCHASTSLECFQFCKHTWIKQNILYIFFEAENIYFDRLETNPKYFIADSPPPPPHRPANVRGGGNQICKISNISSKYVKSSLK